MGWNGLDLINDFSSELGDTSNAFKTKVLRWINEGIKEIATSHHWPFLREKGKIVLSAGLDTHSIVLAKPSAPTITLLSGGGLTPDVPYKVLVTFFEAQSKVESIAGAESSTLVPAATNLLIQLSNIPVSTSPLVTERRIYVSRNGGAFQYHSSINNNLESTQEPSLDGNGDPVLDAEGNPVMVDVPITHDLSANGTSVVTPPEENSIHVIDGEFYFENNRSLKGTSIQDLIYRTNGISSTGTPTLWAPINQEEIQVYPSPASNITASFFYFKLPARVFGTVSSVPEIPSWLYEDLRRYVIWRGFNFRDRAGQESKEANYTNGLRLTISKKGKATKRAGRVRCVTPDSDGFTI